MDIKHYFGRLEEIQKDNLNQAENLHNFYDKSLLYIASGTVVFSISFLKDVVGNEDVCLQWVLVTSWILLTLTILSTLGSYLVSQLFCTRRIKTVNDEKIRLDESKITNDMADRFAGKMNELAKGMMLPRFCGRLTVWDSGSFLESPFVVYR